MWSHGWSRSWYLPSSSASGFLHASQHSHWELLYVCWICETDHLWQFVDSVFTILTHGWTWVWSPDSLLTASPMIGTSWKLNNSGPWTRKLLTVGQSRQRRFRYGLRPCTSWRCPRYSMQAHCLFNQITHMQCYSHRISCGVPHALEFFWQLYSMDGLEWFYTGLKMSPSNSGCHWRVTA